MDIRKINVNGRDTFEVYLNLRGSNGRLQKRLRGFSSKKLATETEFRLKAEFLDQKNAPRVWLWQDWVASYLERERLQLKPSTIQNYEGLLSKWATPVLRNMPLESITTSMIHEIVTSTYRPDRRIHD